jgi:hypothetical protein
MKRSKAALLFEFTDTVAGYRLIMYRLLTSWAKLATPTLRSQIGSFGVASSAPASGSKKEFAIGVNDGRRHNLKRCRDFPGASESTESGRRYRLVLFVL